MYYVVNANIWTTMQHTALVWELGLIFVLLNVICCKKKSLLFPKNTHWFFLSTSEVLFIHVCKSNLPVMFMFYKM